MNRLRLYHLLFRNYFSNSLCHWTMFIIGEQDTISSFVFLVEIVNGIIDEYKILDIT